MFKTPIAATLFAIVLAVAVNIYYFVTGTDLTEVVKGTLFTDMILVLSLVPVYQSIQQKEMQEFSDFPARIKSGMKPVVMFTFLIAVATYILFSIYGDALVSQKMVVFTEQAQTALEKGEIDKERMSEVLEMTKKFYSISFYLPILLLCNIFVGFMSSILAAFLVRK